MINILHIINGWPAGGIAEQNYLIAKYLSKDKFKQYSIGYCHFDGYFVKKFEEVGVPCLHSDEKYSDLEKVIKDNKIDIVHKQTGGGDCPSYVYLLKKMNIPLIETIHCPRKSAIPLSHVAMMTYTTPYILYKNPKKSYSKMRPIQYSIDLKKPIVETAPIKKGSKIIVGRLGRIVADKRLETILTLALMSYRDFGNDIEFHLAGMIPTDFRAHIEYGEKFMETVASMPNVTYKGFIDNKYDFWKTLDICINTPLDAGFDVVFLEAMACGIPILSCDNGAVKYVVKKSGIITQEDIHALYNALKKLYKEPETRRTLGNKGLEYIRTEYSIDNLIKEYSRLYSEIANKGGIL